ncbi:MAG: DNA polymerase III subunit delta [Candidatus Omnitrophica bacterium]|nr:DNA polymerase III subunit delta [Candidatus Omnitrophota bacterium]
MPTKMFPAYLFLGEEDFLKEEAVEKLKSVFLDASAKDFNYSVFYGKDKDLDFRGMMDNLNTVPFLSKKRLVVLKDADSLLAAFKESVLLYLQNPKASSIFVIGSPAPKIKEGFLLKASKLAHLVYYNRLYGSGLDAWITNKAGASGKKIAIDAINAIKEALPNDLMVLSSSMDSIILYTGARDLITKRDVENIAGSSPSHTAFDLMGSIVKRDAGKALKIFSSLKRDKKKETELLGLLAWNARMLLRIKEFLKIKGTGEMRKDLGLSPRMFDQMIRYATAFKKVQVLTLLDEIIRADKDIKTGERSNLAIERLIAKTCA